MNTLWVFAIPPMILVPAMGILSTIRVRSPLALEARRKCLHIGLGLVAVSFPGYLNTPGLIALAGLTVFVWMLSIRVIEPLRRRFGPCLHAADRVSYGEFCFAIAIAFLLIAANESPLLYLIPLLVLTFADAAAAIVGSGFPRGHLKGAAAGKTLSGCVAFAVVALIVTALMLHSFSPMPLGEIVRVSLAVALVGAVTEAVSHRGLDNLTIPVSAFLLLQHFGIGITSGSSLALSMSTGG